MGLLKKIKNIFVEEYEEEEEEVVQMPSSFEARIPTRAESKLDERIKPVQTEKPRYESKPIVDRFERSEKIERPERVERPIARESAPIHVEEEKIKLEPVQPKKEEKFVFPVYFDDNDFNEIEKKKEERPKPKAEVPKKEIKPEVKEVKKESAYKEAFNNKKVNLNEEKKVFRPTPIISPVYGILDKNYYKEDIVVNPTMRAYSSDLNKNMTIDDVRNKAYGTLEDDLTDNLVPDNTSDYENIDEENNSAIFNENDFASAIEEDKKRDIAKDGLKADIESLLNNDEFTSAINFRKTKIEPLDEKTTTIDEKVEVEEQPKSLKEEFEEKTEEVIASKEEKKDVTTSEEEDADDAVIPSEEEFEERRKKDADIALIDDIMALAAGGRKNKKDNNVNNDSENVNDKEEVKINISDNDDLELPVNITDDELDTAYDDVSDLNDSDLFNLIDSMYDKEDK